MRKELIPFDLEKFEELVPICLRNFPDYWEPRFKRGLYYFPYNLNLFVLKDQERIIGTIGIHDYFPEWNSETLKIAGICDVGVDPDYRGQGLARFFVDEMVKRIREDASYQGLALFTKKPRVYEKSGFRIYPFVRKDEIRTGDFSFEMKPQYIRPDSDELRHIMKLYESGHHFPGKCVRNKELWKEFALNPDFRWHVEEHRYFLFEKDRLLEAYSDTPDDPVSAATPVHSNYDDSHCVMVCPTADKFKTALTDGFIFPLSDEF